MAKNLPKQKASPRLYPIICTSNRFYNALRQRQEESKEGKGVWKQKSKSKGKGSGSDLPKFDFERAFPEKFHGKL